MECTSKTSSSKTKSLFIPASITYFTQVLTYFIKNSPKNTAIESYLSDITLNFKKRLNEFSEYDFNTYISKANVISLSFLNMLVENIQRIELLKQIHLINTFEQIVFWKQIYPITNLDTDLKRPSVLVENYEHFDRELNYQLSIAKGPVLVLFTSSIDPVTKQLWCSDCVRAMPLLQPLYHLPDITIIECPIKRIGYVNDNNHPYRKHKDIKLLHIPTLVWWQSTGPRERLVEGELHSTPNIDRFIDNIFKDCRALSINQLPEPIQTEEQDSLSYHSDSEDTEEIEFMPPSFGCEDC